MQEAKATAIDEVVITGTGAQKKITMTGAATTVDVNTLRTFHFKHYKCVGW